MGIRLSFVKTSEFLGGVESPPPPLGTPLGIFKSKSVRFVFLSKIKLIPQITAKI
jgi:hypothetical protein